MKRIYDTLFHVVTFPAVVMLAVIVTLTDAYATTFARSYAGPNNSYPTLEEFAANMAAIQGKLEVIKQPLYDRILYPTAGLAGALTFFANPQGNGQSSESGTAAGTTKGVQDTNMTQNGQLPSPQAFWIDNVQVFADAGSVATANTYVTQVPTLFNATAAATVQAGVNDLNAILNSGALNLNIGQKPYFTLGPLYMFPGQARKRLDSSVAIAGTNAQPAAFGTSLFYADGVAGEPVRQINPGIGIPTGMNFNVTLNWAAAVATPSGFNARIAVHLGGWLFRAAQ